MFKWLQGKKTYITGAVAVLGTVSAVANGSMDTSTAIQTIVTSLLAMTLRAGISKTGG